MRQVRLSELTEAERSELHSLMVGYRGTSQEVDGLEAERLVLQARWEAVSGRLDDLRSREDRLKAAVRERVGDDVELLMEN